MIGIIDYGMGNLRSVQKAFEHVGAEARILAAPNDVADVDKLVLPGVGAFADGMTHLQQRGWVPAIHAFLGGGRPFLGICLGMQLLFEGSEENAPSPDEPVPGLGVLPGQVVRFRQPQDPARRIKIPHMGWNTLTFTMPAPGRTPERTPGSLGGCGGPPEVVRHHGSLKDTSPQGESDWGFADSAPATLETAPESKPSSLFEGLEDGCSVYFVHSYYVQPAPDLADEIVSATSDYPEAFCAAVHRDNVWATQFHPEKSQRVGLVMLANFARF